MTHVYSSIESYRTDGESLYECVVCGSREKSDTKIRCEDCNKSMRNIAVPRN